MTPLYRLAHASHYRYDREIFLSPHQFRFKPMALTDTIIRDYEMKITPAPQHVYWRHDVYGSEEAYVLFPMKRTNQLDIVVEMTIGLPQVNPFSFLLDPEAAQYPFSYDPDLTLDLTPFLDKVERSAALARWLLPYRNWEGATLDFILMLAKEIATTIKYTQRYDPGIYTPEETLTKKEGSCRDNAWLLIQALRQLGLAARFVSGYLVQPHLQYGAAEYHAWAEVYLPGAGWIGIDATSGLLTTAGHVPLSVSAVPARTATVIGQTEPCQVDFNYEIALTPVEQPTDNTPMQSSDASAQGTTETAPASTTAPAAV